MLVVGSCVMLCSLLPGQHSVKEAFSRFSVIYLITVDSARSLSAPPSLLTSIAAFQGKFTSGFPQRYKVN